MAAKIRHFRRFVGIADSTVSIFSKRLFLIIAQKVIGQSF